MAQVNLLSASVVRNICKTIVNYINANYNIPENLYLEYQGLIDDRCMSLQDLPEGIKVKEYLDGVSYVGQYSFMIFYRTYAQTMEERMNAISRLDDLCEWLESQEPSTGIEDLSINFIRQIQSSHLLNIADNGLLTYKAIMTVNFDKL